MSERSEGGSQTDICKPMFTTPLFTIAMRWKQCTHPLMDKWIKQMWYIYAMEYYSAFKREGNSDTCYNMDEP